MGVVSEGARRAGRVKASSGSLSDRGGTNPRRTVAYRVRAVPRLLRAPAPCLRHGMRPHQPRQSPFAHLTFLRFLGHAIALRFSLMTARDTSPRHVHVHARSLPCSRPLPAAHVGRPQPSCASRAHVQPRKRSHFARARLKFLMSPQVTFTSSPSPHPSSFLRKPQRLERS